AILFVDRILALAGLVVVAAIVTFAPNGAVWGDPRFRQLAIAIGVLVALTLIAPIVMLVIIRSYGNRMDRWTHGTTWIGKIIAQLVVSARRVSERPRALLAALALAVIIHVVGLVWFAQLATAITGQDVSASSMASVYPLGILSMILPISYAGFGVGHVAFEQL